MSHKLTITISGESCSGKTTLAHEIISMLNQIGIDTVADKSVDIDSRFHNECIETMHQTGTKVIVREINLNREPKKNG